jgi:leucyl/phenylalanyl-tRNA--protein transferase
MSIIEFPSPEFSDPQSGLLAIGGDLEPESLLLAYRNGIFPWPITNNEPIPWFSPPKRALLFLDEFRRPKSVRKLEKANKFRFAINSDFTSVILNCARTHQRKGGTWITDEMVQAYIDFHHQGYALSVESYDTESLVGGLYGVMIGHMFAGESMFHLTSGASKAALCFLVDTLKNYGIEWIDCQQLTPLLEQFGAREVHRDEFSKLLQEAIGFDQSLFRTISSVD